MVATYVSVDLPDNGVLFSCLLSFGNLLEVLEPAHIRKQMVHEALRLVKMKKPNPLFEEIRFGTMENGLCVEILHIGPFDDEPASFKKMDQFSAAHGLRRSENDHREIYLTPANRTEASKFKTILRYSVEPISAGRAQD